MTTEGTVTLPALPSGDYRWHEKFSQAWMHAVAAPCQISAFELPVDNGIDYFLHFEAEVADYIPVQLKTISDDNVAIDGDMSYTLDRSHYDALVSDARRDGVLVVVALTSDPHGWADAGAHPLRLARRSWWVNVRNARPEATVDSNQQSVTVRLPAANKLCPLQLRRMVQRVAAGGQP